MSDLGAKIDAFEAWAINNGIKKPVEVKVTKLSGMRLYCPLNNPQIFFKILSQLSS